MGEKNCIKLSISKQYYGVQIHPNTIKINYAFDHSLNFQGIQKQAINSFIQQNVLNTSVYDALYCTYQGIEE